MLFPKIRNFGAEPLLAKLAKSSQKPPHLVTYSAALPHSKHAPAINMSDDDNTSITKPPPENHAALAAMSKLFSEKTVISESHNAFVWTGFVSDEDVASLRALLPMKVTDLSAKFAKSNGRRETPKHHSHMPIKNIESMRGSNRSFLGVAFLNELCRFLKPITIENGPYHVFNVEIVSRFGDGDPMHQDKRTGLCVMSRDHQHTQFPDGAPYGVRILLDLGNGSGSATRYVQFEDRDAKTEFTFTERLVAMNSSAAGSQERSPIFHGRFGDGITVSIDIGLSVMVGRNSRVMTPLSTSLNADTGLPTQFSTAHRYFGISYLYRKTGTHPDCPIGYSQTVCQYVGQGTDRLSADDKRVLVHQAMLLVDALAKGGETDLSKLRQAAAESVLAMSEAWDYPDTVFIALADEIGGGGMALVDLSSESHCYLCLSHVPANPQTESGKRCRRYKSWRRLKVVMDDGVKVTKRVCGRCLQNTKQSSVNLVGGMTCHVVDCVRCTITETLRCTFEGCNKVCKSSAALLSHMRHCKCNKNIT